MMSYGSRTAPYVENEILSRSPEWLVPLLYEHLLSNLRRAHVQIEAGDLEGKARSLGKATEILLSLVEALDREKGGELAGNLAALYAFLFGEVAAVGRSLDTHRLARMTDLLSELHEAWVEAAEQVAPRGRPGRLAASA